MKLNILVVLFAIFVLSSCVDYNDVQFKEIKNIEVRNSGSQNMLINAIVDVDNDACKFTISEAKVEAVKGDKILATVSLIDKVKVRKGDNNDLVLPLRINVNGGLLGAAAFALNIRTMRYNVSVRVKSFIASKKYEYKNLTSDEVEKIIGIDVNKLIRR